MVQGELCSADLYLLCVGCCSEGDRRRFNWLYSFWQHFAFVVCEWKQFFPTFMSDSRPLISFQFWFFSLSGLTSGPVTL